MNDNKDELNNEFGEYSEVSDFSAYEQDLEEGVQESRRARREAKKRRRVKAAKAANKVKKSEKMLPSTVENDNIRVKSKRKKGKAGGKKVKVASARANIQEESMPQAKAPKKKKGCLHTLFVLLCIGLVVYAVGVLGIMVYSYFDEDDSTDWTAESFDINKKLGETAQKFVVGEVPDRTIALLMITDKDKTRTDSMILANYDNVNKRLTLVSIPRDIMVEVTDENYRIMRSEYPEPGHQIMKMNHIHHFGGENHGVELLLSEIDHQFDVRPDYYVKIDFDGFNYIVDSIGGIEFEVPQDMDYEDPTQDLYIHLKKGVQVLDGDKAQQLVRFRKDNYGHGYVNGDIDRIQVQQAFLKAFMAKALSSDTIFRNILQYMNAFNKYVTTNATINDMATYATVLKSLNMSDVKVYTLPCVPNDILGEYVVKEKEANRLLYNVFKRPLNEITKDIEREKAEANFEKSNDKKIQVLNGGFTDGLAGEVVERFKESDIPVEDYGTYTESKPEKTVIYTAREGIGHDLVKFFHNGAEIKVDPSVTGEDYDIVVIIGTEEVSDEVAESMPGLYGNSDADYYYGGDDDGDEDADNYDSYDDDGYDDDDDGYDDDDEEDDEEDYNNDDDGDEDNDDSEDDENY